MSANRPRIDDSTLAALIRESMLAGSQPRQVAARVILRLAALDRGTVDIEARLRHLDPPLAEPIDEAARCLVADYGLASDRDPHGG